MDMQISQDTQVDDFLLNSLPNCSEMLALTLPNKDMLYYPPTSGQPSYLKVFDFSSQKGLNEDDEFISVDSKGASSTQPKAKGKQIKKPQNTQYTQNQKQKNQPQNKNTTYIQQPKFKISQTITPESSWKIIADFNKLTLEKLRIDSDIEITVEDKGIFGTMYPLMEDIEQKVNAYNPIQLNTYNNMKFYGNISTLDDKRLRDAEFANVYVTDKILSVIMTCVYNSHPWHLKIRKVGENIYIDKMDNSEIDLITVNESDNTPSDEDDRNINGYKSLAIEATLINEFIKEQMIDLDGQCLKATGVNPVGDEEKQQEEQIEHLGYKYRLWTVDDINVLVRCQVHSFIPNDNEDDDESENEEKENKEDDEEIPNVEWVNIYALNEYDTNSYLSKESNALPLLLKKELQTNHLKLTKWGVNCYLGGVNKMKVGFVTRKNLKENNAHIISGFYDLNADDLLKITNFNKEIAWGIFKEIIEIIRRHKNDGAFIVMKTLGATGAKNMLKMYKLPDEALKIDA